jgi:hypothetical protein
MGRHPCDTMTSTAMSPANDTPTMPSRIASEFMNSTVSPGCRAPLAMPPMMGTLRPLVERFKTPSMGSKRIREE